MNLLVDIGNSTTKVAVFERSEKTSTTRINNESQKDLIRYMDEYQDLQACIISSSGKLSSIVINEIKKRIPRVIELNHRLRFPININYKTPETLGKDRIALAVGAWHLFPKSDVLVIDLGTAITYELVSSDGTYHGGNISPGMGIRYKALNQYTDKLPLLSAHTEFPFWGNSTGHAIVSGVQTGILFEIEGYISALTGKYPQLKVVLTGGDSFSFVGKLKRPIFAEANLLFYGLNKILEFNILKHSNE